MIHGEVARGYESIREAFERCFSELGETGASFVAMLDGRIVADLWGGEHFERDSLVHVYSVTKPMAALCVLLLVDRGVVGLDDAVAWYWPEFAQAGKERVTVRQALSHQAGLIALREPQPLEILFDWERACALLAAEAPWWEPGKAHGEHALFYGHLCGELVRRVDGRAIGRFWREEVATPWGLDFHIGVPEAQRPRIINLAGQLATYDDELYRLATSNPPASHDLTVVNSERWREAEIPAVNGHATGAAVARFYAGLVNGGALDGVRIVSPQTVAAMSAGELTERDLLLEEDVTWGLGVMVDANGYGMAGIGGSLGWADPALGLAEAYITRQLSTHERAEAMDSALRAVLSRTAPSP